MKIFFEEKWQKIFWREYTAFYDKEEAEWLIVGDTFEEFRRKLNPMRSIDHSGEVAKYMMKLSLNELGKSFLNVDKFVSQNSALYWYKTKRRMRYNEKNQIYKLKI